MQPQIAKRILKKKNEVEGLTLLDFKTYFTAMVVKADPHTPGNGTESPGRGAPPAQGRCPARTPRPFSGIRAAFRQMVLGKLDIHMRKDKTGLFLYRKRKII